MDKQLWTLIFPPINESFFLNLPFLLADNHVHSLEEASLQSKNVTVCDISVQYAQSLV